LRFDISDLLLVEDQQTANRSLCQCPNFAGQLIDPVSGHARSYPGTTGVLAAGVCGHLVHAVAPVHDLFRFTPQVHDKSSGTGNDFSDRSPAQNMQTYAGRRAEQT
jgi:hypothetical protein